MAGSASMSQKSSPLPKGLREAILLAPHPWRCRTLEAAQTLPKRRQLITPGHVTASSSLKLG